MVNMLVRTERPKITTFELAREIAVKAQNCAEKLVIAQTSQKG